MNTVTNHPFRQPISIHHQGLGCFFLIKKKKREIM